VPQDHATGHPQRFAIALKQNDRLIAASDWTAASATKSDEPALGYWLGESYWGNGYAREAVAAVID
jgi:[ribosomal protein S5]-alanine N-acetyltransferase